MTVLQEVPSWSEHMPHLALPLIVTSLSSARALPTPKTRTRLASPAIAANVFLIVFLFLVVGVTSPLNCLPLPESQQQSPGMSYCLSQPGRKSRSAEFIPQQPSKGWLLRNELRAPPLLSWALRNVPVSGCLSPSCRGPTATAGASVRASGGS